MYSSWCVIFVHPVSQAAFLNAHFTPTFTSSHTFFPMEAQYHSDPWFLYLFRPFGVIGPIVWPIGRLFLVPTVRIVCGRVR